MRARVLSRVQSFLVRRVAAFPLDYFSKRSPGDLLSIMTNIAVSAADGMMMMLEPLIIALQSFCLALLMCFISLRLSLAILVLLATYFIVLYLLRKRQARLYSRLTASQRALSALAADVHRGFPEIKHRLHLLPRLRGAPGDGAGPGRGGAPSTPTLPGPQIGRAHV